MEVAVIEFLLAHSSTAKPSRQATAVSTFPESSTETLLLEKLLEQAPRGYVSKTPAPVLTSMSFADLDDTGENLQERAFFQSRCGQ
jgi:hypothetical protein